MGMEGRLMSEGGVKFGPKSRNLLAYGVGLSDESFCRRSDPVIK